MTGIFPLRPVYRLSPVTADVGPPTAGPTQLAALPPLNQVGINFNRVQY